MDMRTVCRATGIQAATMKTWQQRGLIPGYEAGRPGVAVSYTVDQAVHVAIMAALTQLGIGPSLAAAIARQSEMFGQEHRNLLILRSFPRFPQSAGTRVDRKIEREVREAVQQGAMVQSFDSYDQLPPFLERWRSAGLPLAYVIVEVYAIRDAMNQAEQKFQASPRWPSAARPSWQQPAEGT